MQTKQTERTEQTEQNQSYETCLVCLVRLVLGHWQAFKNEHHEEHLIASKQNTNNSLSAFDATELKLEQNK